jgi:hypothetical protein
LGDLADNIDETRLIDPESTLDALGHPPVRAGVSGGRMLTARAMGIDEIARQALFATSPKNRREQLYS